MERKAELLKVKEARRQHEREQEALEESKRAQRAERRNEVASLVVLPLLHQSQTSVTLSHC